MLYRILLAIDAVVAAVFVYFFFVGLGDGSVSSFNMGLWLAILAGLAAVIGGGISLNRAGHKRAANALLAVVAVPGLLFGLFMGSIIVLNPRWN